MPAYFETGFSVRQPMWHGLGDIIDEYPTDWNDARRLAGLEWEPVDSPAWVRQPLQTLKCLGCGQSFVDLDGVTQFHSLGCPNDEGHPILMADCVTGEAMMAADFQTAFVEDVDHKQIVRSDTLAVIGSGLSQGYRVIHHGRDAAGENGASMEQIVESFPNADGNLKFETAGSVKGGRQVWALLRLDEPYRIDGDESETIPYIALLNSHDGLGACTIVRTQVRVVCWNTYQMALADGARRGTTYSFRHSGDPAQRIEEARLALSGLRADADEYRAMSESLTKLRVDATAIDVFLSEFLPNPAERGEVVSDRVQSNIEAARDRFRSIYETSTTTDGIRGNGYGLFQTATEYLDHVRGFRTQDSYMGRSILGLEKAKARIVPLIQEAALVG